MGVRVEWLDGDTLRNTFCRGLGFSKEDRDENVGRIAFLAELLTRNGVITIVSAISPFRAARDAARRLLGVFVEVYVDAPLEVCEARDYHKIYSQARNLQLSNVTGLDQLYEPPLKPDVHCRTDIEPIEKCVEAVMNAIGQYL